MRGIHPGTRTLSQSGQTVHRRAMGLLSWRGHGICDASCLLRGAVGARVAENSEAVAKEHYFHATEADYTRAIGTDAKPKDGDEKAAQKAAQYPAEVVFPDENSTAGTNENRPDLPGESHKYLSVQNLQVPPRGVEPLSSG